MSDNKIDKILEEFKDIEGIKLEEFEDIEDWKQNHKYKAVDKGHKIYTNYYELINSGDMIFKYALLWWMLRYINGSEWYLNNDYEFSYKFLRRMTEQQIKSLLQKRLNKCLTAKKKYNENKLFKYLFDFQYDKVLLYDIEKYKKIIITNDVDEMANNLYNLFNDICKKSNSKTSKINEKIFHSVNRIIRCFHASELLKENINDGNLYKMVTNYTNKKYNRKINFDY